MKYTSIPKYFLLLLVLTVGACSSSKLTISLADEEYDFAFENSIEYETLWEAIENIDFTYLSDKTLEDDQEQFCKALESVVEGDLYAGEKQFQTLYHLTTDTLVKNHAQEILAKLYFLQSKWNDILELDARSRGISGIENDIVLFQAFSRSPKESYSFPSQPTIIPLDLAFYASNPLIQVRVNGHKKEFLLDTGAGLSVVASDVAKECGIFPVGTEETTAGTGTGKRVTIQPALIEELQIGELSIRNHPVLIIDKSDLEFRLFSLLRLLKIEGIIGWPAIQNMKIEINYQNRHAAIEKPTKTETKERNLFWLGMPVVILKTPDGINLNFGLDTGANKTSIHDNMLKKITIENTYNREITDWSAGGIEKTETRMIPNLTLVLNGSVLHFEVIRISSQKGVVFVKSDGRLGVDIAQNGSITIDYLNGRFELNR